MRDSPNPLFPLEKTIEEIQADVARAFEVQDLFRLKADAFQRYVKEAACHLKAAKLHAQALDEKAKPSAPLSSAPDWSPACLP